ncbi:hypothetical protein JVU11DRAFT_2354 [Chiua virens]|nr:hypothetical protein JVU11DRAFT_2354 [Chiua virens]
MVISTLATLIKAQRPLLDVERSLDQVKDVVRRKLGLGRDTDVSLKQMGPNALLDLEDDDDFQAFSILLKSSDSLDIQVTVGRSQGLAVPPPIAPSREKPSVSEPLITPLASHPKEPVSPVQPTVATTTKVSTATKKTSDPSVRKRKVSFDGAAKETSDKPAEKTPATAEPTEEPPKKKIRKTKPLEPTPLKATSKAKVKKTTALGGDSEARTSASKGIETFEQPAKKTRKKKEKESEPIETDGTDSPNYKPANKTPLRPEKPEKSSMEGSKSKSEEGMAVPKPPTIGVCASIPQTSASTSVLSEVAAAILSRYVPKASETTPPEPPAKRESVRRTTTESFTSSTLPAESTTVSRTSANEIPTVPMERRLEIAVPTRDSPQQTLELSGPSCPICLEVPFHIRYCCPTVQKGPDAIRERLEELKRTNTDDQQPLIKELEDLLRDSKVTSKPAVSTDDVQSREVSQPPDASWKVEMKGAAQEGSDDASEGEVEYKGLPASGRQETPGEQPLPSNDDLEAVIRGSKSRRQSVLGILDRILDDEYDEDSASEDEKAELEDDPDEVFDSNKAVTESTERDGDDGITGNSHDPPVLRGLDGDSSEETHVGSDDRMVVDGSIRDKGAAATVEEQLSSPVPRAPVLQSFDAPIKEHQVSGDSLRMKWKLQMSSSQSNPDPIEAPAEDVGSSFSGVTQSTPAPGVARRLQTRHGEILDDEAERPILLDQLSVEAPLPTKRKSRGKDTEMNSQEPAITRRSPRFSSFPATRPGLEQPRRQQRCLKNDRIRCEMVLETMFLGTGHIPAATPSSIRWETLAEPSSPPSVQLDGPPMLLDELMSSSPHPESTPIHKRPNARGKKGPPRISQAGSSQGKQRLFDMTPSQVPFPYSQHKNPISTVLANGKEKEVSTDSGEESKVTRKKPKPSPYRTLSQLASQATLYSPSLPTPTNKNAGKRQGKETGGERGNTYPSRTKGGVNIGDEEEEEYLA